MVNMYNKIFIFALPLYIAIHFLTEIYFLHNYVNVETVYTKNNTEKLAIILKEAIQNEDVKTVDKIIQIFQNRSYYQDELNNSLILKKNKDTGYKYFYNFVYLFCLLFYMVTIFRILNKR